MFIAHLPAGWLAMRALLAGEPAGAARRRLVTIGMAASVAPDLDLLWFYWVDGGRHVHHSYFPHLPAAWAGALLLAAAVLALTRARREAWLALAVIAAGAATHLLLDTVAGGIRWGWPMSDAETVLAAVPDRFDPWWLNFVLHWTFALELGILAAALAWYIRRSSPAAPARANEPGAG